MSKSGPIKGISGCLVSSGLGSAAAKEDHIFACSYDMAVGLDLVHWQREWTLGLGSGIGYSFPCLFSGGLLHVLGIRFFQLEASV